MPSLYIYPKECDVFAKTSDRLVHPTILTCPDDRHQMVVSRREGVSSLCAFPASGVGYRMIIA